METQQLTSTTSTTSKKVKSSKLKKGLTTIIIHMKKMDLSGTTAGSAAILHQQLSHQGSGGDSNNNVENNSNNNHSEKSVSKSETSEKGGRKAFYKLIFKSSGSNNNNNNNNSSSNNNDSNNNSQQSAPASNNSYTKVTVERANLDTKISQLTIDQSSTSPQQQQQQPTVGNSLLMNQSDLIRRYNSSLDEYELEDSDERARIQRAIEIQEGIEIDPTVSADLMESITPSSAVMAARVNISSSNDERQEIQCRCQQMPIVDSDEPNQRIHSQVAYCHYLVPDLQKITACCYYWGKMDRYEAERLLEGKPEGTFLLRDSAQDEYLFSVSFRKYGRSLHARIEHFNHRFSFDSHDPSVFMATTITGLLEHYKDPTSVMFFEPMLTSPLHRNHVFSLQQLCRAAIVSNTTYDGINKLCLPSTMKSYLKEYHYRIRVRVKQFPDGSGCALST